MDPDKTGRVSRDAIMAVFYILNEDFPEIRRLSKEEGNLIFGFLDKDGSSTITLEEFLEFGNVLLLEFTKESDYETLVERHFPQIFRSRSWQSLCMFVHSAIFEYCTDAVLVANAVIIAIQSYPELSGQDIAMDSHYKDGYIDTVWELMETIFTAVYILEIIVKVLVDGWKKYSESPRNVFDFSVTLLAVFATLYVYYPNAYSDSRLIRFIVMARVLRLTRLLFTYKAFEMVGIISVDIIPAASNVILILLFLMYFFSALGSLLYGGLITRDPDNPLSYILLEANDFVDNAYWANNFNDMVSGMNVLFNLLVVNNWTECEIGFEFVTGGKWVRFFFFFFHLFGVVVINNVVIAFIINAFFQQFKTVVDRQGWEEEVADEAIISGARARFRANTITGTNTGVIGGYIARVRPRHMDVELDERAALRKLFTRTSTNDESIAEK
ncbi:ion transport protein [Nitzschia inconspicua]|uniref:Ion transport protein n=1 Tax=Nitzschia inconspicua TaxID=303405 RepID=A0A9K3KB11_9STRA|nr:ion transport protein [Nitzschia inconspicua]KAG7340442.1 ion transport protein [Nitzschia inconspicua]